MNAPMSTSPPYLNCLVVACSGLSPLTVTRTACSAENIASKYAPAEMARAAENNASIGNV